MLSIMVSKSEVIILSPFGHIFGQVESSQKLLFVTIHQIRGIIVFTIIPQMLLPPDEKTPALFEPWAGADLNSFDHVF